MFILLFDVFFFLVSLKNFAFLSCSKDWMLNDDDGGSGTSSSTLILLCVHDSFFLFISRRRYFIMHSNLMLEIGLMRALLGVVMIVLWLRFFSSLYGVFCFFFVFSSSAHFKWNKLLFELPLEERIISFIEVCLWFRRCFFLFFIFDSSEWKLKAWVVRKHLYSIHLHLSCSSLLYRGIRWITHGAYMYAIPAAMLRLWF